MSKIFNRGRETEDGAPGEPDAAFDEPPVYDDDDPPIESDDEPSLWDDMSVRPIERETIVEAPDDPPLEDPAPSSESHEPLDERPIDELSASEPEPSADHEDALEFDERSADPLPPVELFASDPGPDAPVAEPRPVAPPLEVQVAALLEDPHKRIVGDLQWVAEEDGAPGREFLAPVRCAGGELRVRGQWCAAAGTLRFSLISRGVGRIAALDVGHAHQGVDGRRGGETHFHRRDRRDHPTRDLEPLAPDDLAGAWRLFCALTSITHEGALADPPPVQETLL